MAADATLVEELASASPAAVLVEHLVLIVIAMERHLKGVEPHTIALLGVTLGLLDLADHARVHVLPPSVEKKEAPGQTIAPVHRATTCDGLEFVDQAVTPTGGQLDSI